MQTSPPDPVNIEAGGTVPTFQIESLVALFAFFFPRGQQTNQLVSVDQHALRVVDQQVTQLFHSGVVRFEAPLLGFFRGLQVLQVRDGSVHFEVITFTGSGLFHAGLDSRLVRFVGCFFCFKYFLVIFQFFSFLGF